MPAYFDALLRYFEFSGRSTRRQFWMFQLTAVFVYCAAAFLDVAGSTRIPDPFRPGFFLTCAIVFQLFPQITVTARRLQDGGRSGWWWLLGLVPLGNLVLLAWAGFSPSQPGENAYGPEEGTPPRQASSTYEYDKAPRRQGSGGTRLVATVDAPQRF